MAITPALYIEMAWAMLGFSSLTEIYDPFSRGRKSMKDYSRDERERERVKECIPIHLDCTNVIGCFI